MRKDETIGGHNAAAGIYWNKGSWNLVTLAATLSPEGRPEEAYFLGRRKKGKKASKATDKPTKLEKEIEAKRDGKK